MERNVAERTHSRSSLSFLFSLDSFCFLSGFSVVVYCLLCLVVCAFLFLSFSPFSFVIGKFSLVYLFLVHPLLIVYTVYFPRIQFAPSPFRLYLFTTCFCSVILS